MSTTILVIPPSRTRISPESQTEPQRELQFSPWLCIGRDLMKCRRRNTVNILGIADSRLAVPSEDRMGWPYSVSRPGTRLSVDLH